MPTPEPKPPEERPAPIKVTSAKFKLPSYRGAKWERAYDSNARPGINMGFTKILRLDSSRLTVQGEIGPRGSNPTTLMVLTYESGQWQSRSPSSSFGMGLTFIGMVDADRMVVSYQHANGRVFLIVKGQAIQLGIPPLNDCIAIHPVEDGRFFVHCHGEVVFEVKGTTVTRLVDTEAQSYLHIDGSPTSLHRAWVRSIAQADTGETVGIYRMIPPVGQAVFVRFDGKIWEEVCSLGESSVSSVHYLSKDSMAGVFGERLIVVNAGVPREVSLPTAVVADRRVEALAIRASSTDEFVVMDNFGAVYRFTDGDFKTEVAQLSHRRTSGLGFRQVMIGPDGTAYALYRPSEWALSILYRLKPN